MFSILVRQAHDGRYLPARDIPDHIANAAHKRLVIRYIEECRKGILRVGYKIEKAQ